MRRAARRVEGLTLVETLVAVGVSAVLALLPVLLFVPAAQTDGAARQRTLAVRAAETWLDRYRANQEPIVSAGSVCAVGGSVVTCTYPYGYAYPAADWPTHTPQLAGIMSPFRHVVTVTVLAAGVNVRHYQVQAQTFWKQGGQERSTTLTTRMAF